ncbi:MAG: hypothetical protein KIT79_09700 [Deltaproteobacteria bacterium]|nr:hypothetical protein [Deltaproteobacteria bacterium]
MDDPLFSNHINPVGYAWTATAFKQLAVRQKVQGRVPEITIARVPDFSVERNPEIAGIEKGGGRAEPPRWVQPFKDHPGLFLDFADLKRPTPEETADAIRIFVGRVGLLGIGDDDAAGKEPFSGWSRELDYFTHALDVWESLKAGDLSRLQKLGGGWDGTQKHLAHEEFLDARHSDDDEVLDSFGAWILRRASIEDGRRELDLVGLPGAARDYLAGAVDKKVSANVHVRFAGKASANVPFEIRMLSKNLLGGIWLQFASYVSGKTEFRRCDICETWTPYAGEEGVRKTRRYCCTGCRNLAVVVRKQALALHRRQKSIRAIAEETGIREEVINRWIEENPPEIPAKQTKE